MFVFYNLYDLVLLHRLQVIQRVIETGVKIMVPAIKETDYSAGFWMRIADMADKTLVDIKDSDNTCFDFVSENEPAYKSAGKSLLALIHFCIQENAVLIVNGEESFILEVCLGLGLETCSLDEFNQVTINNKEYFEFMAEMKREQQYK